VSAALFLGIDHSALSVASTSRSLAFYRALSLRVSERSVNRGPAQERLDGVAGKAGLPGGTSI
jgi:catechol 2,3-dioxygenase-like lactoylglutathione lyase family enzyme